MANLAVLLNFKTRVLLAVISLMVLAILGFAARVASLMRSDLETLVSSQLNAQVEYIAREMDEEFQFRIDVLNEIAASIPSKLLAEPAQLHDLLIRRYIYKTLFPLGVAVIDRQGRLIADHAADLPFERSGFVGDREYFSQVMANGKPFIGGPVKSRFAERTVVPIAVPIRERSGEVAGVLLAPLDPFAYDLFGKVAQAKIGKSGKVLVMSAKDDLVVAASEAQRTMKPLPKRGANPLLDRRLYAGFEGAGVTVNSLGIEVVSASSNMKTTGWAVIASIDSAEAFAPIKPLTQNIFLTAGVLSLSIAVALVLFMRRAMHPLDQAGAAMRRMTDGSAPLTVLPIKRVDEIGKLILSFNQLIISRKQADEKVRNLNQTLEQRVSERTHELQLAVAARDAEISERIKAQQSALKYAEGLQAMTRRLAKVQEWERHQLANELHDRVSSNLATINLHLKNIAGQPADQFSEDLALHLDDLTGLIEDTVGSVKDIVSDLHPAMLDYGGLYAGLTHHTHKFERRTGIESKLIFSNPESRLTHEQEFALFRITQEALVNCAKHGAASAVEVCVVDEAGVTKLTISDDGMGFDPAGVGRDGTRAGLGLLSMQERAEAVGGRFSIESAPGRGTTIMIEIGHAEPNGTA